MNWRLYAKVASKYGITLQEYEERFGFHDFEDTSWCIGGSEIILGVYQDEELRCISFFHEMGHCLWKDRPPFEEWAYWRYSEAMAWRVGIELAAEWGITFSDNALVWAAERLATYFYVSPGCGEGCPPEFLPQACQDAGLPLVTEARRQELQDELRGFVSCSVKFTES